MFSPLEELDVTHSQTLDLFSCCWLKHIRLKVPYLFWRMQILHIVNHLYPSRVKHLGKAPGSHLPRVLLVWGMFIACMWWHCTVQCTCFQEGLRLDLRKKVSCGLEVQEAVCVCLWTCVPAHMAECWHVCLLCADKDLGTRLSIPGSWSLSINVNDLHMGPANTGYSNIAVYSNMGVDYFS